MLFVYRELPSGGTVITILQKNGLIRVERKAFLPSNVQRCILSLTRITYVSTIKMVAQQITSVLFRMEVFL